MFAAEGRNALRVENTKGQGEKLPLIKIELSQVNPAGLLRQDLEGEY